jgi:hypothetical protein
MDVQGRALRLRRQRGLAFMMKTGMQVATSTRLFLANGMPW